jgi:hypothetical protein
MGAYLSSPICEKDTIEGSNNRLAFAASSMQGWRMSQEVEYSYLFSKIKIFSLIFRIHIMLYLILMIKHHYLLFMMVMVELK